MTEPTLKQLRILKSLVVAGSITKATRLVGLSQPTLSQQLTKMEESLGTQLVVRSRETALELTPAGQFWYRAACDILEQFDWLTQHNSVEFASNRLAIRFGTTPSLRGHFLGAAARIAAEDQSFSSFEFIWALNSVEVMEMLRMHKINCAVVTEQAVVADRSQYSVHTIFQDSIVWAVPDSVPEAAVADALDRPLDWQPDHPALRRTANVGAVAPWHSVSEAWFRLHLPFADPFFRCMTHQSAVELVADGLATCHVPMSLFPNLPASVIAKVRLYDIASIARNAVLVMPKHQMSLKPFVDFQQKLLDFAARDYQSAMPSGTLLRLPVSPDRAARGLLRTGQMPGETG